jgi:putative Holliday junction resolvase
MSEPDDRTPAARRLLALDVGERRIGVAVSEGRIAVPLVIIEHQSRAADLERVAAIAKEQEVSTVVVGLPVGMSGAEGEQAKRTRRFGDALARRLSVPIVYQDERLSSAQVAGAAGGRIDRGGGKRPRHAARIARPRIDDLAATVILQAYIDAEGSSE